MTYEELIQNKVCEWARIRTQEYKGAATDADNLLTSYQMQIFVYERAIKQISELEKIHSYPE